MLVVAQAEMSRNVQQYSKDIYLRATEAQQCQIQSTIVLPLFDSPARNHTVGVLEVVQTAADMPFACVISTLNTILQVSMHLSFFTRHADVQLVSLLRLKLFSVLAYLSISTHHHSVTG